MYAETLETESQLTPLFEDLYKAKPNPANTFDPTEAKLNTERLFNPLFAGDQVSP